MAEQLHEVFSQTDAPEEGENEHQRRELESRAAGTKVLGTWHATETIQECREACGGAGYLSVNRFDALKADTDVFTTFEGDNHVLLQLVAKGLLTDYASDFEDMDQFGMVRFVAGLAVDTVLEKTNVHKLIERIRDVMPGGDEWDQEAGLLDPHYQLMMLRFREEHMLGGVARRLKRGIDNDMNPGEVFSRVQDHVIGAARAHVERLVVEAFVDKVGDLPDGDQKVALRLLCDLHALCTIENDRAWFMEHGRLTSQRSKAITREINDLLRKIRPLAVDFVDAFGVPRRCSVRRTWSVIRIEHQVQLPGWPRRLARGPALGIVLRLDRGAPPHRRGAVAGRDRQRPEPAVRRRRRDRPPARGRPDPRRAVRRRGRAAGAATRPACLLRRRRHRPGDARADHGRRPRTQAWRTRSRCGSPTSPPCRSPTATSTSWSPSPDCTASPTRTAR